ncbi:alpha-N-arabinofuranosidase [Mucilaginibacter gracilis]|uniref:non-reducing end alpha-L-arabinofuranosidase n=1 Tax=Mucilaginibacter gracilis TaxID=423350 RepID=A0A495J9J6_9SPHI|nr:alpha-L-arabinofuranosidase C-terminal domain-containing protein [Mucilaginibacter gracilis]RKR85690.1 alpha-N-arabinofuranosidase [Mucilaginibacter gracilis]
MKRTFSLIVLGTLLVSNSYGQAKADLTVTGGDSKLTISRNIYGQFSEHLGRCIYGGFWVDPKLPVAKQNRIRLDIVEALKKIHIPNLRWPGGCFADEYHWRDGIGPSAQRPKMVNTNWGGVTEDNSFGTHEFLELCSLLKCEPYITGNVGSGTVDEMSKWVEYLNFDGESPTTALRKQNGHPAPFKVSFWGVGNESWGCGGNMTAEYYSDQFKRYASFAKNYPGTPLKKIATGPSDGDYHWMETCMKNIGTRMWGISLHNYTIPTGSWSKKGSATSFTNAEYFNTMKNCLRMDEYVTKHSAIMDKYDPEKKVALVVDEWGIWTDVEPGTNPGFLYQQNSLRDALVAATTLNIFNNHCDRVKMANLAQTVNVLQALILTDNEKMLLTPTYHVFDLYKVHQDATYLPIELKSPDLENGSDKIPAINVSASIDSNKVIHISLVNLDPEKKISIRTGLKGLNWSGVTGQILTSEKLTDVNTFQKPNKLKIETFTGASKQGDQLVADLPAHSVVVLTLK